MRKTWHNMRVVLALGVALVACPCHLPVTLPLLVAATGGSLFGFTAGNLSTPLFIIASLLFFGGLYLSYRWIVHKPKSTVCSATPRGQKNVGMKVNG